MINIPKISKNLIAVSLISSLLVFWLGSRSLTDAHTQFSGATQLQRSVAPETTLIEVSRSMNVERSTVMKILLSSSDNHYDLDTLHEASTQTKSLFEKARQEIKNSRPRGSEKSQYRYSSESIDMLIDDLDDKIQRISIVNSLISSQVYLPLSQRDKIMRDQLFNGYVNLISAVNNLRKRTNALPEKDFRGVLSTHDTKDAILTMSDAIDQTSTLLNGYLLVAESPDYSSTIQENLSLRIFQQNERVKQSLSSLSEITLRNNEGGISNRDVLDLESQYNDVYREQVKKFSLTIADGTTPKTTLLQWQEMSSKIKQTLHRLTDASVSDTYFKAESIKRRARTSLLTNALLVLLCMIMAYASFRVGKRIQYQANHDDLTELPNRRSFSETLADLFRKTDPASHEKLVLMTLDLNDFKNINDTMGHAVGDKLLVQVAKRLDSTVKDDMQVARMGGDEFAIAYNLKDNHNPYEFAEQIRAAFKPEFKVDGSLIKTDTSIGYSCYPDDANTVEELQITSDFAMFSAKQSGGISIQPYDREIAAHFENRATIEKDLSTAIENNELELHYQPQFNLNNSQVDAVEALIRWNHPTRGMVSPFEFIEIAEEKGLMPAIGNWVLNEACQQAAIWNNDEDIPLRVAINVSVHQIMQSEFVTSVLDAIKRHDICTSCIELEITESVVMADIDWIVKSLETLKSHGLRIALDDFGTGYSSLSQLQTLPLDTLKIDRSFISAIDEESGCMKSVTATIASIAEIYNLETVAEGIETVEQLIVVNKLGIDIAQGYYYSKPLPKDQVAEAVARIDADISVLRPNKLTQDLKKAA